MSRPRRIQRKRTKGWKMPENTVYVCRPSKWGNPFTVGETYYNTAGYIGLYGVTDPKRLKKVREEGIFIDIDRSLKMYRRYMRLRMNPKSIEKDYWKKELEKLRGKSLACWCPLDEPCHADILLELANK